MNRTENVDFIETVAGFEFDDVSGRLTEKKDTEVFECDVVDTQKEEEEDSAIVIFKGEKYANAFLQIDSGLEEKFEEEGIDDFG